MRARPSKLVGQRLVLFNSEKRSSSDAQRR
jgi:hypothetical protein